MMNSCTPAERLSLAALEQTRIPFFLGETNGRILYANQAWKQLAGPDAESAGGRAWYECFKAGKDLLLDGQDSGIETELACGGEARRFVELRLRKVTLPGGRGPAFACFVLDRTDHREQIRKIQISALKDSLTGLANRVLLLDRLNMSIKLRQRETSHGFSLFYIDLDDFKQVNDGFGHGVGDKLLVQVAKRLRPLFRDQDTICRWGGDEFIILLDGVTDEKLVTKKARRLHEVFSYPFHIEDQELYITASVGITMSSLPFDKAEDLLLLADQAMYKSKAAGKNKTTVQAPVVTTVSESKQMAREIRSGCKQEEFYLVYQPVIDLKRMRVSGLEALARWAHPQRGTLYPGDFFPVAEQSRLSDQLGAWILWKACGQMAKWREMFRLNGELKLHLNLFPFQLGSSAFQELLRNALEFYNLEPGIINLECPKESLFNTNSRSKKQFQALRNIPGVNLVVDNMRMNLKNLNFFFNYPFIPFKMVKFNHNGIDYLSTNSTVYHSLKTFISVFSQMNIELAIKGIESRRQLETLQKANCHYGQGHYLSKPLSTEETEAYLKNNF